MVTRTNVSNDRLLLSYFLPHRGWSTWKCMTSSCTQTLKIWSCRRTEGPFHDNTPITELVYWSYVLALEFRFFFFACSISLLCTLLVLPHTSLLFCLFQFVFCLTMLYYSSRWLPPFLFRVFFVFTVFAFISFHRPLGVSPFGSFIFIFRFLCHGTFTPLRAWFFLFLLSVFAIVSFAFAFSACFVQSLVFFISGLCYFSWRSVYLGSARLALCGPGIVGLFVLVSSVCCS